MNPCVFLDRDGVLNEDNPNYVFRPEQFVLLPRVAEALALLKSRGFLLIVITNQSGIAKKLYSTADMEACHVKLHQLTNNVIDHLYFSPYHPAVSASLSRKPESLLFEKAIARFSIDIGQSWMVGDRKRDLLPARKLGIKTIVVGEDSDAIEYADVAVHTLWNAANHILNTVV